MNILYIGSKNGTSRHRWTALQRLGHDVEVIDTRAMLGLHTPIQVLIWKFSGYGLETLTYLYVRARMKRANYDFCVVDHGESVSARHVRFLKRRCNAVTLYNSDNPFVDRDKGRWRILLNALKEYDSYSSFRDSSIEEARRRGVKCTIRYVQTADEIIHTRRPLDPEDAKKYSSDVAFVGTWMPERSPFIVELLDAGIDVKIFGANWHKAPEYERLKSSVVIGHFLNDEEYVRAIQYSKISIGLVSQGNFDLHTHRSTEIPAIGAALCAKRTSDHLTMYEEGVEAVFWDDARECARICLDLLKNPEKLQALTARGTQRVHRDKHFNAPLMDRVVKETLAYVRLRSEGG